MKNKTVVMTFGRMNPPTIGHEKLIKRTLDTAQTHGADHAIFVSHSQDAKKNPLHASDKVKFIKHAFPDANVKSSTKESPSFLHVAKELHKKGYKHLIMVAGSDRTDHYEKLLNQYNGHPDNYNFHSIKVVSAGHRDPDAEGAEGMSGTKMREAASQGKKNIFKSGLMSGLKDEHKEAIYHKVRSSMGITEQMSTKQIPFLLMNEKQKLQFASFVESTNSSETEKDEDETDEDSDEMLNDLHSDVNDLDWEDIFHLYDDDEVTVDDDVEHMIKESSLNEDLNIMQRLKKRIDFLKIAKRREIARKIALNKPSSNEKLKKRSTITARRTLEKRLLKGRTKSDLTVSQKNALESRLNSLKNVQTVLANKIMPKIRDIEQKRLQRNESTLVSFKQFVNEDFGIVEEFFTIGDEQYEDWGEPEEYAVVYEAKMKGKDPCWSGYQMVGSKKKNGKEVPNCVPVKEESERKVALNKPFLTPDGPKKRAVYVKNDKGNVVKVNFGDPNMEIKRDNPERRSNFRARHNCENPGPKHKARYWSCKYWSSKPVSKMD